MVGLEAEPRPACGDPQRLLRPHPRWTAVRGDHSLDVAAINQLVDRRPVGYERTTAQSAVTSATSTAFQNRIESR